MPTDALERPQQWLNRLGEDDGTYGPLAGDVTSSGFVEAPHDLQEVEVTRVELDRGPHVVVAIARGGAWEGAPLGNG